MGARQDRGVKYGTFPAKTGDLTGMRMYSTTIHLQRATNKDFVSP